MEGSAEPHDASAPIPALVRRLAVPSRWLGIVIGVQLLAAGPPTLAWIYIATATDRSSPAIVEYLAWGWLGLTLPWVILAIFATLNWRPFWQRCLVFAPAILLTAVADWLLNRVISEQLGWSPLGALPLMVAATAAPAFVMRVARRWMLVPRELEVAPRAASIATLLIATTLCAFAVAWTRSFEPAAMENEGLGLLVAFVSIALVPAACMGLTLVLALRATMTERVGRSCLVSGAIVMAALVIMPGLTALMFLLGELDGRSTDTGELFGVAKFTMIFTALSLAIGFASFVWLRLLGYRLLTIRDSR